MNNKKETLSAGLTVLTSLIALSLLLSFPASVAAEDEEGIGDEVEVVIGGQDVDLDADEAGEAQFRKYQDYPSGVVLEYFNWNHTSAKNYFQVEAWDATQTDERFVLNAGYGPEWKIRAGFHRTPFTTGGGALLPLGRGSDDNFGATFTVADFVQQTMEDPDGNGIPFYTDPAETASDNALVFGLMNELLGGMDSFFVGTDRETGYLGFTFAPGRHWTVDFDAIQETKDGSLAMGSGTYQRITDVNADGNTDYDYFFSVRGVELPAPIDYRTTRFIGALNYEGRQWYVNAKATFSEFENGFLGATYDNPFWFTDTQGGGALRGLWEQGRASFTPSNEAWDLTFSGGVNLPARTRITGLVNVGEQTQDVQFLPMTTNTATIGTADINGDGFVDANDDPTVRTVFENPFVLNGVPTIGTSLDASVDTRMYNLTITSRPVNRLKLLGRYRSYEYAGQEGIQAVSGRTEYIESRLVTNFKSDTILHVPIDYTRDTLDVEATYRFTKSFKLRGFYKMLSYDYDQYGFDPAETDSTRDTGSRAVSGTDDDSYGLTAHFGNGGWFSGYLTAYSAERTFDGSYTPAFSGENADVRQFDIADRDRDAVDLRLDFMPSNAWSIGVGYRFIDDDYPGTLFGLQKREVNGVDLNLNYAAGSKVNLFAFADVSEWDGTMNLRTKCSNCSAPDPALAPWDVPAYDWFSDYTDTTTAFGLGLAYDAGRKTKIDFTIDYTDGEIEQNTTNPTNPTELNPANPLFGTDVQVARGFPFPDQSNTLVNVQFKWTQQISSRVSGGFWYMYEDFDLVDFQLDPLQPYGANFLDVEDATRFLFLGSRISDYTAHVAQVFLKITL